MAAECPSLAAEEAGGTAFSVCFENDTFGGTDENYTNGLSLAISNSGPGLTGGIWNLFGKPEGRRMAAYDLGQLQFTPDDIERSNPDPDDRPYAGMLYLGLTSFLKSENSLHGLKLLFGVVGPASFSEALQRTTHRTIGSKMPQGWSYQLKNEPIVNVLYEYRRRIRLASSEESFGIDLVPRGGIMLGNYLVQSNVGTQLRIGYRLLDDFGTTKLRGIGVRPLPADVAMRSAWGGYIFAGAGAAVIGRDITLDGNTFARSRSVDKRPIVPEAEFGASIWMRRFQATFSFIMLGKEFYGQRIREDYGSIVLTLFL